MSTTPPEPTEQELRAAYEEELRRLRVEQLVLESIVTIINLGMRRSGLVPGTEIERDAAQVQVAIEAVRALLPLVERTAAGQQASQIRDALSQLQLAYVRIGGQGADAGATREQPAPSASGAPGGSAPAPAAGEPATGQPPPGGAAEPAPAEQEPIKPGEPGPAQRSGRLWVPGQ
jgi:hypothetical protein